ncbi:MAG: hypothetical protein JSS91_10920 [Bacteroidetes bacterium]|nr:hypothetical protein [Bacteroidota bacterium]
MTENNNPDIINDGSNDDEKHTPENEYIKSENSDPVSEIKNVSENPSTDETLESEDDSPAVFYNYESAEEESDTPKMTDTLKVFLQLREIDSELAEIEEEKGDLPFEINSIQEKLDVITGKLNDKKERLSNLTDEKNSLLDENSSYEERISKYDEQKFNVRSNTEYDEITKAIEALFDSVSKNENKIKEIDKEVDGLNSNTDTYESSIKELSDDLKEKQAQLNELNKQYMQDESALKEKRDALLKTLEPKYVSLYERINGSYKGEATAIVRKGNCSGCYNSIPPQRVIEIKTAERIFTCQSCGRILISEELQNNDQS